ncbi:uncharacterized protein LOC110686988 [Chenopodium quinoa]|uniref:uncharacterized protein LOC110686988 n=1 Tax=Chenopodium quinoa TaxID=63459 RepID=UPI000B79A1BB|nr:uncharacterized protein LOC110686988 [Chenopodium quinoa]
MTTVRALLAVATMNGWFTTQMDVTNAFLHGDLEEDVYMSMPVGYSGISSRILVDSQGNNPSKNSTLVCKLTKSLYGLKKAPRQWFKNLSTSLGNSVTIVLVYVDDLLITGNNKGEIARIKKMLASHFHMKDLGSLRYFLGLEIDHTDQGIFISQKKYTTDLLREEGLLNVKPLKLPIDSHLKLSADKGTPLPDPARYQQLLGKLIYLTITRPDISFTVQLLSQFMHSPTSTHMQAVKRLLSYLAGTVSQGVLLASSSAAELAAYCDSDWAICPTTRRSTTSYCVLLGKSPLS